MWTVSCSEAQPSQSAAPQRITPRRLVGTSRKPVHQRVRPAQCPRTAQTGRPSDEATANAGLGLVERPIRSGCAAGTVLRRCNDVPIPWEKHAVAEEVPQKMRGKVLGAAKHGAFYVS